MHRKLSPKGLFVVPLLLALVMSLGTAAWARPLGCGPGGMNLTPEQAGQLFDLKEQFMSETASLRKAMWMKKAEMAALWKVENPDQNQIKAKQKEMNALKEQLQEKMTAYRLQARKIVPFGPGMGMGKGMMGMGMAMMGDGPGMGMGPGCGF
jgi:Spy/CpxP family protein refolding chaperone